MGSQTILKLCIWFFTIWKQRY